jgi:hypothetical protein
MAVLMLRQVPKNTPLQTGMALIGLFTTDIDYQTLLKHCATDWPLFVNEIVPRLDGALSTGGAGAKISLSNAVNPLWPAVGANFRKARWFQSESKSFWMWIEFKIPPSDITPTPAFFEPIIVTELQKVLGSSSRSGQIQVWIPIPTLKPKSILSVPKPKPITATPTAPTPKPSTPISKPVAVKRNSGAGQYPPGHAPKASEVARDMALNPSNLTYVALGLGAYFLFGAG